MSNPSHSRPPLSVWARLAAFLSFLAVLSALLAPVSMLAQEMRTGQLTGVCHFDAVSDSNADSGAGDAPHVGAHCDMCGALGWALPPLAVFVIPSFAAQPVATAVFSADVATTFTGLPFSCGPPIL